MVYVLFTLHFAGCFRRQRNPKTPITISLDSELLEQARELDINLSKAATDGIEKAVILKMKFLDFVAAENNRQTEE